MSIPTSLADVNCDLCGENMTKGLKDKTFKSMGDFKRVKFQVQLRHKCRCCYDNQRRDGQCSNDAEFIMHLGGKPVVCKTHKQVLEREYEGVISSPMPERK